MTAVARPVSTSDPGRLTRLYLLLTQRRGNVVWTAIVRLTGVMCLLGIFAAVLVPDLGSLVGFFIVTVWVNGPLGMFLPATYEPILMLFGRVYPPLLIGCLGIAGTLYVEYLNYKLYRAVLESSALGNWSEGRAARWVIRLFNRAPFLTVWLCSWSPLPYWLVRFLAPLAGYPIRKYLLATFLGRFPRLWFFAALGLYWRVDLRWLFAVSGVAILLVVAAAWWSGPGSRHAMVRSNGGELAAESLN